MPKKSGKKAKQAEPEEENDEPIVIEYPDMPPRYFPSNCGSVFGSSQYIVRNLNLR